MSKTLEELGYEKLFDTEYTTTFISDDKATYEIVFVKKIKSVYKTDCQGVMGYPISMEELKAIYKWCEEHNWI